MFSTCSDISSEHWSFEHPHQKAPQLHLGQVHGHWQPLHGEDQCQQGYMNFSTICSQLILTEFYRAAMKEHDLKVAATRSERVPTPPLAPRTPRKKSTTGSDEVVPAEKGSRWEIPVYKNNNKTKRQVKGEVRHTNYISTCC